MIPHMSSAIYDGVADTGGSITPGTYKICIVPVSIFGKKGNPYRTDSDVEPIEVTTTTETSTIAVTIPVHPDKQVRQMAVYRTTNGNSGPYYLAGVVTNGTTSLVLSGADASLPDNEALESVLGDASDDQAPPFVYARPPAKKFCRVGMDSIVFVAGEEAYETGTVSATSASSIWTFSGGTILTSSMVGKTLRVSDEASSYLIESVDTPTRCTTSIAYSRPGWKSSDPSGADFVIIGDANEVCPSMPDEPEYFNPLQRFTVGSAEGGAIAGLCPYMDDMLVFTASTVYRVSKGYDVGSYDVIPTNSIYGAHAPSSIIESNGGVYFFNGEHMCRYYNGSSEIISRKLGDELDNVDYPSMKQYVTCATADSRLYVAYAKESDEFLDRIAVYDLRTGAWDIWKPFRLVDMKGVIDNEGDQFVIFEQKIGDEYGIYMFTDKALNDGLLTADYSGSVIAGSATSITVDTALPTTGNKLKGLLLRITGGTGIGQERWISDNLGGSITVEDAFDTPPDSTSSFTVGAIKVEAESGELTLGDSFVEKDFKHTEVSFG